MKSQLVYKLSVARRCTLKFSLPASSQGRAGVPRNLLCSCGVRTTFSASSLWRQRAGGAGDWLSGEAVDSEVKQSAPSAAHFQQRSADTPREEIGSQIPDSSGAHTHTHEGRAAASTQVHAGYSHKSLRLRGRK